MTRAQKNKALLPLRFAVKGWAFTMDARLPSMLARAEAMAAELDVALRDDADAIIAPLRDAVARIRES